MLDNWLSMELHHWFDQWICSKGIWSKTNQVNSNSPTGLPHHSLWGCSFFRSDYEVEQGLENSDTYCVKYLSRRLETEFGFMWNRFQYAGMNSQTMGQEGTTHSDCQDEDEWNISFLYYTNRFWNPHWGGVLRLYDDSYQQGLDGRKEHIKNHQIAEIDFKPNRLLMFDGRIPHGADAPHPKARYIDRRSMVIRGDEVRIPETKEYYYANDRVHSI